MSVQRPTQKIARALHETSKIDTTINQNDHIFTPIGFSTNQLMDLFRKNLSKLGSLRDFNYSTMINHVKSINDYVPKADGMINSGTLIHIKTDIISNSIGIVLEDYRLSLSTRSSYRVLLPSGEIKKIYSENIIFALPEFINRKTLENLLTDDLSVLHEQLKPLTETLNIFMSFFIIITNNILSKDLIRTIYLKTAFTNYQSSLSIMSFTSKLYENSKSLRNFLNIKYNPFSFYALLLSCHFLVHNDPIHFRKVTVKSSIFNILNPLTQITTSYFKTPIILSQNIENIYNQPNELILKSYHNILSKSNHFQIYNVLKTDENFKKLMMLVKYAIVNPDSKLMNKLDKLLPIEGAITPQVLFDFLVKIGIYEKSTNPLLASGIYGLNSREIDDISLSPSNIDELQYAIYKDVKLEKLPSNLSRYNPFKSIGSEINDRHDTKNFSAQFLEIIQDVKSNIWKSKGKYRTKLYKLTEELAFSVEQMTMTKYKFNFLLPIPGQAPNENISIQEPIQVTNNLKTFPKAGRLNQALRINQPCIKITLTHNLIDVSSLTSPQIKIGLDVFKKIELIDDEWFQHRNLLHLKNSKSKMECWLALNKLSNLLQEKEKARIRMGYLKTFGDFDEKDEVLKTFQNFFNDNVHQKVTNEKEKRQFNYSKDKEWMVENVKLLLDECVGRFCVEKRINVASRSMLKEVKTSIDFKVFKKFKIFKWYADSYDTFNFQLSSNPGDLTAYVNCLRFLGKPKVYFGSSTENHLEYQPLGLKYYASFTRNEFIETHLNRWQLLRYLLVNSFHYVKNVDKRKWDPKKLDVVTQDHYDKCLSQSEGFLELVNRMNRYEKLKRIDEEISGGTDYKVIRCIVTDISSPRVEGYWLDMNIKVEINTDKQLTVGDRLMCSKVVCADILSDICIVE